MTQSAVKGPNEKFCSECAAVISIKAEICPKCGVRQSGLATKKVQVPAGGNLLSCPSCGTMAKRGGYATWVWVCAVCLFPFGLLAFLLGRKPTQCMSCGTSWQA